MLQEIKNCTTCKFPESVQATDESDSIYCRFTYYHSDKPSDEHKFMIILQNPGEISKEEKEDLKNIIDDEAFISFEKDKMLKKFLKEDNYRFFEKFITCLRDSGLIKYNLNDPNFDEFFMKDFIITDAVKCRADTKLLKHDIISNCTDKYLFDEIKKYGHNKLIFVFSRRAWSVVYDHFKPEKSDKSDELVDVKIASVHGMLFYCKTLNSYFIPLSHFSQTIYYHFLRNSYFDYLNEGLTEFLSKKS